MPYQIADSQDWENLKNEIKGSYNRHMNDIPKRLRVIRSSQTLSATLDLHGLTVQSAFDTTLHFLSAHHHLGSKNVLIITGKGTMGEGLIKREFNGWLENDRIKKYVRSFSWQNAGGAVRIILK